MKKLLFITLAFASFQTFAFTSLKLKEEVVLKSYGGEAKLEAITYQQRGNIFCVASMSSNNNAETLSIPVGTSFEVTSVDQGGCKRDPVHECRLEVNGRNQDKNIDINLICASTGFFASEVTLSRAQLATSHILSIK
ncbi:MAG: hypothetical protein H7336_08435 [Bacteriovorax sp.]|nr:hypothetical protein [Bacteriovorax sp.]